MKKFVKSATSGLAMKPYIQSADEPDAEESFEDILKDMSDDFDYIIDGLSQVDLAVGEEIAKDLQADLKGFIADIAENLI